MFSFNKNVINFDQNNIICLYVTKIDLKKRLYVFIIDI